MTGWIKLHRSIKNNLLWNDEPFTKAQAWIDLLLHANFTDNQILIKGQALNLKRGQQARSEITLAETWQWSRGKVRRFLELLKKQGMIEHETGHLTSVITICNYDSFQSDSTADGTSVGTSGGTSVGQVPVHSKECKERKECEEGKKPSSQRKFSDDDLRLAQWIFGLIRMLNNNAKEPNFDSWANTIRLMRERDNRTHGEIASVFKWANQDNFWQTNILSPAKLREKFDQLSIKANQQSEQKQPKRTRGDELAEQARSIIENNDGTIHQDGRSIPASLDIEHQG